MYEHTITVFNFHEKTGAWYTSVFSGVSLYDNASANATPSSGKVNASSIEAIIHVDQSKSASTIIYEPNIIVDEYGNVITTDDSKMLSYQEPETNKVKSYTGPKAYAKLENPDGYFTFKPETDFFVTGNYSSNDPIPDEDYEDGLYNAMNDAQDGVYMIASAIFYGLLPHFEIGGR